jgi:hypothetical protein
MEAQAKTHAEKVIRETAEKYAVTPGELMSARRKRSVTFIRDTAIKRIRAETPMSLPDIGKLFGMNVSSVWGALRSEYIERPIDAEQRIAELWPDHDLYEIAAVIGMSAEGVRAVGKRMGLGRPFRKVKSIYEGHRAFTPRCAEILRQHGVML